MRFALARVVARSAGVSLAQVVKKVCRATQAATPPSVIGANDAALSFAHDEVVGDLPPQQGLFACVAIPTVLCPKAGIARAKPVQVLFRTKPTNKSTHGAVITVQPAGTPPQHPLEGFFGRKKRGSSLSEANVGPVSLIVTAGRPKGQHAAFRTTPSYAA